MAASGNLPRRLMQAFLLLHRQKLRARPVLGINPGEMRVLRSIDQSAAERGAMVSELSDRLQVSAPFITQMTNNLVRAGLASRSPDPDDRRAVRLRVTARGKELMETASREFGAQFEGLARHLGPQQCETLLSLLAKVSRYFESVEVEDD